MESGERGAHLCLWLAIKTLQQPAPAIAVSDKKKKKKKAGGL